MRFASIFRLRHTHFSLKKRRFSLRSFIKKLKLKIMAVVKTKVKKAAAKKATKDHPTFKEMIVLAIVNLVSIALACRELSTP